MQARNLLLLLTFLTIFVVQPLEAQFSMGVNAGVTRMKVSGDRAKRSGIFVPDPGFSSALRFDYRFSDALALSLQPGFSQLRSSYKVMNDSATEAIDSMLLTLNSVSLPMHAIVWSENGRFFVLSGVQLDYVLGLKGKTVSSSYSTDHDVRDLNLYVQFGAGFIVPLGKPYLSFELRYSHSIFDLNDDLVQEDSYLPRTKLTNLSFIVGLQFPLGTYSEKYHVKRKNR